MPEWMRRGLLLNKNSAGDGEGGGGGGGGEGEEEGGGGEGGDKKKWAGKYDGTEDLEKAYREQRKLASLSEIKGKLVGKDGHFASYQALETAYLDGETLRRKPKKDHEEKLPKKGDDEELSLDAGEEEEEGGDEKLTLASLLKAADLDTKELAEQFVEEGSLTDAQYKAIQDAMRAKKLKPYSRAMIDEYASGLAAKEAVRVEAVRAMRTDMAKMLDCKPGELQVKLLTMSASIPADEKADIVQRLNDPKRYKGAVRDILAFHAEASGSSGDDLARGTGKKGSGTKPYTSSKEMTAARKGNAPDYHERLAATPQDKISLWIRQ